MVVYRAIENKFKFCADKKIKNEYMDYQNNIISAPSRGYIKVNNTHNYDSNNLYLHFFHFYEDAIQYISERKDNSSSEYFIAFYEIPDELLEKHLGFGIYPMNVYSEIPVLEYAIPYEKLDSSFILGKIASYSYDITESVEYEEYILGGYNLFLQKLTDEKQKLVLSLRRKFEND